MDVSAEFPGPTPQLAIDEFDEDPLRPPARPESVMAPEQQK
ncbi:MAG TPA: hypothetical protein VGR06_32205 [Actinophytocola sp.]|jgi:hypothetical protein|nr:hypothetical protein [Actinophytocola sp.]